MTFFVHAPTGRQREWRMGPLPFAANVFATTWQDSIVIGDLAETELTYFSREGKLARVLRLRLPPRVGAIAAARAEAIALARTDHDRAYVRLSYDAAQANRGSQVWDGAIIADNGAIWIALADPQPGTERRHLVVAPDGRILSAWRLPAQSRLLSIRGPELLVATRDENDVERLVSYRP
jgi:hypothetical protein